MNTGSVESFLRDGCGRCDKYQTPECKVHDWSEPLEALRELLQRSEMTEQLKWGFPTYSLDGSNLIMLVARSEYCALSFFRGAALDDPDGVLEKPGPNSRYARLLKFESTEEVVEREAQTLELIERAIAFKRSGVEFVPDDDPEPMPVELEERLASDDELQQAYEELTPGRQRSFILYVSGAKKSDTRVNRAERCVPKIMDGKGFNER